MLIHLHVVCGCFHATVAELSNCIGNHMAHKSEILLGPLQKKFTDLCFRVVRQQNKAVLLCFCPLISSSVIINPVIFKRALVKLEASIAHPFSPVASTSASALKLTLFKYIAALCMHSLSFSCSSI